MFSRIIVTCLVSYDEELTIVQPAKVLTPEGSCVEKIHAEEEDRTSS